MTRFENNLRDGLRFGDWTLQKELGEGGNGIVWEVSNGDGRVAAMKFLQERHWKNTKRYGRFQDEIYAQKSCQDIPGVLPLLDHHVPESPTKSDPAWFVSVLGQTANSMFDNDPGLERVVEACRDFAGTLAAMHRRGVSHRDIKPDNLFWLDTGWAVGDFGLADFPDKTARTSKSERIGPLHYHAPEMLEAAEADGAAADVWSLAKTHWVLATGQRYPLPGQHFSSVPALTISEWVTDERAWRLDRVLEMATAIDPSRRLSMASLYHELDSWLQPRVAEPGSINLAHIADNVHALNADFTSVNTSRSERMKSFNDCVRRVREFANDALRALAHELTNAGFSHVFAKDRAAFGYVGHRGKDWLCDGPGVIAMCGTPKGSTVTLSVAIYVKFIEDDRKVAETIHAVRLPSGNPPKWKNLYTHACEFECNCPSEDAAFADVLAGSNNRFEQTVKEFLDVARSS